jgi:hypothetical protein
MLGSISSISKEDWSNRLVGSLVGWSRALVPLSHPAVIHRDKESSTDQLDTDDPRGCWPQARTGLGLGTNVFPAPSLAEE